MGSDYTETGGDGSGLIVCGLGLALCLDASHLTTHWQAVGENAWGGETGPGRAQLYGSLGLKMRVLGVGFWNWLNGGTQRLKLHG